MPEAKVKQLLVHEVNPKNAQGTIDLDAIDSVTSSDQEKRCQSRRERGRWGREGGRGTERERETERER